MKTQSLQLFFSILFLSLILTCSEESSKNIVDNDEDELPDLEWLSTVSNKIVDESGQQIILHGVNRSGYEYDKIDGNRFSKENIDHICQEWHANVIRLPFNQEWVSDNTYLQKLESAVKWAKANKAYIILDLQWQNTIVKIPDIPSFEAIEMWKNLALHFKDESAVLYDIHNEAHDIDFLSWKSRAAEIIEAIQSVHPDALILVSGLNWASDLSDWAASPFDYENIVYSVHVYTWFGTSANWGTRFGNYAQNIPIFCGEFGGYESDIQWGKELIRYLNQNQIGWTAWSWVDDPHLTSRDDHTTPTEFGQLVKTSLERFEEMSSSENEIFDISFDFITASRATINWKTKWESDSKVLYGQSTSYNDSVYAAANLTAHSIKLDNLQANTTYHCKLISIDDLGFIAQTGDTVFTTL